MSCVDVQGQLSLYLYGELAPELEEAVEAHCAVCAGCSGQLERERALQAALDLSAEPVPPLLLAQCRQDLRERLAEARAVSQIPAGAAGWWARLSGLLAPPRVWKPAAALALVALGFAGGRMGAPSRPEMLLTQAEPVVATRVRNVNAGPDGGVRIEWEETRQRSTAGLLSEEPIRRLLLSAVQEEADPALRVESVELLRRDSGEADVRRTLLAAVERDSNPGVRLKALEGLKAYAADPEVRSTLSRALLRDENPGVRTLAVDVLTQHQHQDIVGVLQQLAAREDNTYIQQRTRRALREMNASVETF